MFESAFNIMLNNYIYIKTSIWGPPKDFEDHI